jgi:hypothetical protein
MKNTYIPPSITEYRELVDQVSPDPLIRDAPFYRGLANWVIDERTPIFYDQTHPSERDNFSINFNWMVRRDYSDTTIGPPETVQTMYAMHEYTHMTHWLPTRLDEVSADEYAQQFTGSEYRASNETEISIHYRIPELRSMILQGVRIAFDVLQEQGMARLSAAQLANLRPVVIEGETLDSFFSGSPQDREVLARLKGFNGNREWARNRYQVLRPHFMDATFPLGSGLSMEAYEPTIEGYESTITQEQYEHNMIRNVRFGFAMCGLPAPQLESFADAVAAARQLEGQYAITQA